MTGGYFVMAFHVSFLLFQSSFSVVSSWSVVSVVPANTGSSSAMPVDSMFTSIGFFKIPSIFLRLSFP